MHQVNNSLAFRGKPIESKGFFHQVVKALGITIIDDILKEDFVK